MPIKIRNLKKSEIPEAAKIFYEAFNSVGEKWSLETAEKRIHQYYAPKNSWVAILDSRIVGVLTSKIDNVLDHQELYIDIVAVDPTIHKQGIGKALLDAAENYAKRTGINYIWLTASPKIYSFSWYLKIGFKETSWKVIVKKITL